MNDFVAFLIAAAAGAAGILAIDLVYLAKPWLPPLWASAAGAWQSPLQLFAALGGGTAAYRRAIRGRRAVAPAARLAS